MALVRKPALRKKQSSTPEGERRIKVVAKLLARSDFEQPNVISFPIGVKRKLVPTRMGNH